MRRWFTTVPLLLLLAVGAGPAAAQSAGWWPWAAPTVRDADRDRRGDDRRGDRWDDRRHDDRRHDDDRDDDRRRGDRRYEERRRGAKAAPAFCRSGAGHPVFGMRWCRERSFDGDDRRYDDRRYDDRRPRWIAHRSDGITFRTRRLDRRVLDAPALERLLGGRVLDGLWRAADVRGPLTGRWARTDGRAAALQLRLAGRPFAELTDFDRDGRVDVVLVNRDVLR